MARQKLSRITRNFGCAALLIAAAIFFAGRATAEPLEDVVFQTGSGPLTFHSEVMRSSEERAKGLMFRTSLAVDRGMLFDFGETVPVRMWMKNTFLPLDMIFIRENGTVAGIAHNTLPMSEQILASPEPVRYVLEVNAGTARTQGIEPDTKVTLPAARK